MTCEKAQGGGQFFLSAISALTKVRNPSNPLAAALMFDNSASSACSSSPVIPGRSVLNLSARQRATAPVPEPTSRTASPSFIRAIRDDRITASVEAR